MSIEDRLLSVETRLDAILSNVNSNNDAKVLADWLRLDLNARVRDLEEINTEPPDEDAFEDPDIDHPYFDSEGGVFSGVVYLSGLRFTGLDSDSTKPWVKVDVANSAVTEQDGPPSNPFPPGEEWYEKGKTVGDIHVTRL